MTKPYMHSFIRLGDIAGPHPKIVDLIEEAQSAPRLLVDIDVLTSRTAHELLWQQPPTLAKLGGKYHFVTGARVLEVALRLLPPDETFELRLLRGHVDVKLLREIARVDLQIMPLVHSLNADGAKHVGIVVRSWTKELKSELLVPQTQGPIARAMDVTRQTAFSLRDLRSAPIDSTADVHTKESLRELLSPDESTTEDSDDE